MKGMNLKHPQQLGGEIFISGSQMLQPMKSPEHPQKCHAWFN